MRWKSFVVLVALCCGAGARLAAGSTVVEQQPSAQGTKPVHACVGARQVTVESAELRDAEAACEGAGRALVFLAGAGLKAPSSVVIEVVSQLPGDLAGRAVGCYMRDTKRILILSFEAFQAGGEWFRMPASLELYRAVSSHEMAHWVVACHPAPRPLPIAAHEYVAYVALFATMDPKLRTELLGKFPGVGFRSTGEISDIAHLVNPHQFGVDAWRHFLTVKNRELWLKKVIAGEVVQEAPDDPGAAAR